MATFCSQNLDSFDGKELKNLFQEEIVVEQMTVPAVRAVEPSAPPFPAQSIASADSISNTGRSMTPPPSYEEIMAIKSTIPITPLSTALPPVLAPRKGPTAAQNPYIAIGSQETMSRQLRKLRSSVPDPLPNNNDSTILTLQPNAEGTTSSPAVPKIVATKTQTTADMLKSMTAGLYNVVSSAANRAANVASNAVSSAANAASSARTTTSKWCGEFYAYLKDGTVSPTREFGDMTQEAPSTVSNTDQNISKLPAKGKSVHTSPTQGAHLDNQEARRNLFRQRFEFMHLSRFQQPLPKLSEGVGVTQVDQRVTDVTNQDSGYSI